MPSRDHICIYIYTYPAFCACENLVTNKEMQKKWPRRRRLIPRWLRSYSNHPLWTVENEWTWPFWEQNDCLEEEAIWQPIVVEEKWFLSVWLRMCQAMNWTYEFDGNTLTYSETSGGETLRLAAKHPYRFAKTPNRSLYWLEKYISH